MSKELQTINDKAHAASSSDAMLAMIERVLINNEISPEKLQQMLDIQTRMYDKQAEIDYNIAFSEMQPELPPIPANGKGHNNAKYAKKEDMNLAVNPILAKHGFSLSFSNAQKDGYITTRATLRHRSGHSTYTEITLKDDTSGSKNVVQAVGSSQAYGERYTMKAILNLTILGDTTDDDAKAHDELATDAQRKAITQLYDKLTDSQKAGFAKEVGPIPQIKKKGVDKIIAKLNKSIKENK